eukprot:TRINITY_DN330_c0_g1_i1.p1 TRINITY_DN330_c0_g1~~TRINITY_DN330_c0_g1_i1.p1  ORF type:complete len:445 (+),score=170.46 TRINITY_DN330_c0_g1_i1:33-1337(+)
MSEQGSEAATPASVPAAPEGAPQKSKAELRRERAAIQEAQRAAKKEKNEEKEREKRMQQQGQTAPEKKKKEAPKKKPEPPVATPKKVVKKKKKKDDVISMHPAVLRLGEQYREFGIVGGNARCIAMMNCFRSLIADYTPEENTNFKDGFILMLRKPINYLTGCRRLSQSMGNGINYLKSKVQDLPDGVSSEVAKDTLLSEIDTYVDEILMAVKTIAEKCVGLDTKGRRGGEHQIKDGDVILTYARSNAIEWVFRLAQAKQVKFEVVAVDSRPLHEGKQFALTLANLGIPTTYCLLNSLSSLLPKCNKVFVGASSMLTNGSLVSRTGTSMIAMMAKHFSLPVLCFCETYKFADKVWLGSLTNNEEADTTDLMTLMDGNESPIANDESDKLKVANYMYDLTPAENIDMVVTELGPMHPTSVPVIVRERIDKSHEFY